MTQPLDEIFDALSHRARRELLHNLMVNSSQHGLTLTLDSPPDTHLTVRPSVITADQYHVHLPKLADYGYIEWSPEDTTITRGPRFSDITPILQTVAEQDTFEFKSD